MVSDKSTIAPPTQAAIVTAVSEAASFEERWAAWHAKGVAHDRAVRGNMAVAAPVLLLVAAVALYVLLGR
jgi:small-conductance mechanosensitive channel